MDKKFFFFLLFVILICLSFLISFRRLDPDFGWHLRTGELILDRGVPQKDWYSYTMPDFPWVAHEWLTDVLIYKTYSNFGFQFLLLIFLVFYTFAFFILIDRRYSFWNFFFSIVFGYLATLDFLGIRPQLLTILFIAILWKILNKFLENYSRLIYFLPILFIIWGNLHGGFLVGISILFLNLVLEIFKRNRIFRKLTSFHFFNHQNFIEQSSQKILILTGILALSFFSTIINPYGLRIYTEVFRTVGDSFLRFHIIEWMPLFSTKFSIFLGLYIILFWGLLIPLRRKIEFNKLIFSGRGQCSLSQRILNLDSITQIFTPIRKNTETIITNFAKIVKNLFLKKSFNIEGNKSRKNTIL